MNTNLKEMIETILSVYGTYRAAEERTGIARSTLNEIYKADDHDNITLATCIRINEAYETAKEIVNVN